jgi:D-arginine dehydrogenase
VAGFDPEARGFYWLAGQGGYGIQTAPALAELAVAQITGDSTSRLTAAGVDEAALSPARF